MRKGTGKLWTLNRIILTELVFLCFQAFSANVFSGTPSRIELTENWKLSSSKELQAEGSVISIASYKTDQWYQIHRMPATVLQILQEDGVYPGLYIGKNLMEKVPQDLYKQDWWYRATF